MTEITLKVLNNGIIPKNCYELYSDKDVTKKYHLRGLESLHKGHWKNDISLKLEHFKQAFGYFSLALKSDPKYFCAREALMSTAEFLENLGDQGLDSIIDTEEYAINMSDNPHPGVCHLMHAGWFNATEFTYMIKK